MGPVGRFGLFDANAHPDVTLTDGRRSTHDNTDYSHYTSAALAAGFVGACAVGLPGTDPRLHFERCGEDGFLHPVSPWNASQDGSVGQNMSELHRIGYRAVKIHPRLGGPLVGSAEFREAAAAAGSLGIVLFVCTYPFGGPGERLGDRLLDDLERAVDLAPDTRMVLLHGGAIDLLRYVEFCRANPHLLLDVSLTLMKYRGSSVDADLRFAFAQFDRRICIGSDHPWYTPDDVADAADLFLADLDDERCQRILRSNIEGYLER